MIVRIPGMVATVGGGAPYRALPKADKVKNPKRPPRGMFKAASMASRMTPEFRRFLGMR